MVSLVLSLSIFPGLFAAPVVAGGFAVPDQSAEAMGMASAVTALSDRPSTLFYNVGGAAFFTEKAFEGSLQLVGQQTVTFEGLPTNSSVVGVFDQEDPSTLRLSGYWIQPLTETINFGLALYSPFALDADWGTEDNYSGRFVSLSSEITTYDLNPSVTFRFGDRLGLGFGVIARTAELTMLRRVPTVDPFSGDTVDIADLAVDSGEEIGYGWNAGLSYRVSDALSWGFSYRSRVEIDFTGTGLLTQILTGNDQLDEVVALSNPFGQDLPLTTTLKFPDTLSIGLALGLDDQGLLTALTVDWTGWSSFEELDLTFTSFPVFGDTIVQNFDDAMTYRLGLQYTLGSSARIRLGLAFDETPQPAANAGPFLVDADRNILTAGWGKDWLDVALMYVDAGSLEVADNPDGIDGTYQLDSLQLAVTIKKK